jgi:ABC-2 type transport system ATP-binding protein
MAKVIQVDRLRKRYGPLVAVDDISFDVVEGEIFGILGLNGAGKTTAVECIQGLRRPDGGHISVLGMDPQRDTAALRQVIGSQLQESALPDRMKVWEALDLFSSLGRPGAPDGPGGTQGTAGAAGRAGDWRSLLEQWGLASKRKASFGSLSGGQRQRLFVALALVNRPKVVFLDEMTTGLDPAARRVAWDLIHTIREQGTTVVLVTHFMDEAEQLCDRLAIMKGGEIIALDSPQSLITTHATQLRVRFSCDRNDDPVLLPRLRQVPHVQKVARIGSRIEVTGSGPVVVLVAAALVESGHVPADLQVDQPGLEDVFLQLTGARTGNEDAD